MNETQRARRSSEAGFTILEVLIAAVMLAIGVVAMIGLQVVFMTNTRDAEDITAATMLGEMTVEQIRGEAVEYNSLNPGAMSGPLAGSMLASQGQYQPLYGGLSMNRLGVPFKSLSSPVQSVGTASGQFKSFYCIEGRIDDNAAPQEGLMVGQVRVSWPRRGQTAVVPDPTTGACPANIGTLLYPAVGGRTWDTIYVPFMIRRYGL